MSYRDVTEREPETSSCLFTEELHRRERGESIAAVRVQLKRGARRVAGRTRNSALFETVLTPHSVAHYWLNISGGIEPPSRRRFGEGPMEADQREAMCTVEMSSTI